MPHSEIESSQVADFRKSATAGQAHLFHDLRLADQGSCASPPAGRGWNISFANRLASFLNAIPYLGVYSLV